MTRVKGRGRRSMVAGSLELHRAGARLHETSVAAMMDGSDEVGEGKQGEEQRTK